MGEIIVELYWKHAPTTCRNFAELMRRGYYNGTKFHRIIRDFMIQGSAKDNKIKRSRALLRILNSYMRAGGDPTGTGKGGMSIYGECFEDEIHDDLKHTGEPMYPCANRWLSRLHA